MPIQWNKDAMYTLACRYIEQVGNTFKVDYEKMAETWPDQDDRPGVPTLKKQITQLRKDANLAPSKGNAGGSAALTPRSTMKTASKALPKTPSKRSAPLPKTPISKKRKTATSSGSRKRKLDSDDDDEDIAISSSEEEISRIETTDEDEGIEVTPKDRRILPTRSRKLTAKSYAEASDSESKDVGARSDSNGDDNFDPTREPKRADMGSLQKRASFASHVASSKLPDDEQDAKNATEDDAKSATVSHASFKSAKSSAHNDEDEDHDDDD